MSIRLPEPSATEIVPHAIVDKTVARCSAELETLEHRLDVALATARRNEERLAATSVGRVIDDDFEAAVLAVVERYADVIATGRFDPTALADPDRAALVLSAPSVGLPEPTADPAVDPTVDREPSDVSDASEAAVDVTPEAPTLGDFEPDAALDALGDGVNGSTNGHAEPVASSVAAADDEVTDDNAANDEANDDANDDAATAADHDVDATDTPAAADVELDALVTSRRLRRRRGTTVVTRRDTALVPAVPVEDAPEPPDVDARAAIVDLDEPSAEPVDEPPADEAFVAAVEPTQSVEVVPAADAPADGDAVPADLVDDDSVEERHSGWPAHLLIHAGLILVVFALILFRLS